MNIILFAMFPLLFACQSIKRSNLKQSSSIDSKSQSTNSGAVTEQRPGPEPILEPDVSSDKPEQMIPRVGLVLGPGGLRANALVGFLQELHKAKISPVGIVGFEMSALVAAIYAQKAQQHEVEWQMQKITESNIFSGGLFGSIKKRSVDDLEEPIRNIFSNQKIEQFKIPFACSSLNMPSQKVFLLNRGEAAQVLKYCIPSPPLFESYGENIAMPLSLSAAIQFLKSKGANYIVFVSLMSTNDFPAFGSGDSELKIAWSYVNFFQEQNRSLFQEFIVIPVGKIALTEKADRRQLISVGQDIALKWVKSFNDKFFNK